MLPPSIPTSFVPHPLGGAPRRASRDLTGVFGVVIYIILGIVIALAAGVFFYGRILASTQASRDAELAKAKGGIDSATIENFVRLHDRLDSGQKLLSKHIAFSNFFSLLERIIPSTVRFSSLNITLGEKGGAKLSGAGVARNFNALAAVSSAFAADGRIRDAIFSSLVVSPVNGSVAFALSASLDQKLIEFTVGEPAQDASSIETSTTTPL
ncbi:MAG: hypothetical protein Q7J45_03910 [bacterium]|nr:hypothetical protein [bacterium]